ncbi:MAG: PAS domain-containing sensor histidine kinase, partial [Anaerolineae bacterium]|nr:PAS domain-containing sensor histidine kinase [Anaerolineae bacterium]
RQRPMQSYEPELLRLYGVTIGHLIVRQREQETIRKLSNAVQASASMVVILDAAAVIEFVNDSFCRVLEYAASDVLGQPIAMLWRESAFERIWPDISAGSEWQGELVCPKKNGALCETIVSVSPIRVGDAEIKNYVVVLEDITELKQARQKELQLQLEQERSRVLQAFITDAGHEFRTPLSVISTSSYLLKASQDDAQRHTRADQIEAQVDFLSRMVNNMLYAVQLSGDIALETAAVDLRRLVHHALAAVSTQAATKQLHWDLDLEMPLTVQADERQLTRAVREIIKNAIEFSLVEGVISIRLYRRDDHAGLRIQDAGAGISAQGMDKIFDRFFRVDAARTTRGTGLGLFIAKYIVEAHQGGITVESTVGQGSTFEIWLPLERATVSP